MRGTTVAQGLREAWFSERQPDGRIRCSLCPHDCRIVDGSRGACAARFNEHGVLYTLVYDRIVAASVEAIDGGTGAIAGPEWIGVEP